jgi:hypothetical protein
MLRKEDWMVIQAQVERGVYQKDLAAALGVHPRTVRRALERGGAPSDTRRGARKSKLDAFKPEIDRWLAEEADRRVHGTVHEVVADRFEREAPSLSPLPGIRYDTSYRERRWVAWDGYIDVRGNRYSVPDHLRGSPVAIRISLDGVLSVYADDVNVAEHRLRAVRDGWVIDSAHHDRLWRETLHVERRDLAVYEEVLQCNS